jgi:thiamine kinase-like enzyme
VSFSCSGLINNVAEEVEGWPEYSHFAEKLREIAKDVLGHMTRNGRRDDKAFNVLNHGDTWKNNILFRYSNTGQPESAIFVDYQLSHFTSPAVELRYLIYTSTNDDIRMRHESTLLQVRAQKSCSYIELVARILTR